MIGTNNLRKENEKCLPCRVRKLKGDEEGCLVSWLGACERGMLGCLRARLPAVRRSLMCAARSQPSMRRRGVPISGEAREVWCEGGKGGWERKSRACVRACELGTILPGGA